MAASEAKPWPVASGRGWSTARSRAGGLRIVAAEGIAEQAIAQSAERPE